MEDIINLAIRVDASSTIGIGHVMRCFTLARLLQKSVKDSVNIIFVCSRELPESLSEEIRRQYWHLILIDDQDSMSFNQFKDAAMFIKAVQDYQLDLIVIDHYSLDVVWEREVRTYTRRIFVIDDLANRMHACDILLDQNLYANMANRYGSLVPPQCLQLLGPTYLLLREEFLEEARPTIKSSCQQVLVNFGGSDPTYEIDKVLCYLEHHQDEFEAVHFHIVAGPANTRQEELKKRCGSLGNVTYYPEHRAITQLLSNIDLCIGAGGVTMWERCFMGVPSIVIAVAENQVDTIQEAEGRGLIWSLGCSDQVNSDMIFDLLKEITESPHLIVEMSKKSLDFMQPLRNAVIHPIVSMIRNYI